MDGRVEMMDLEIWKQHRKEKIREAEQNRLAKELRAARKKRTGSTMRWRASSPEARSCGIWDDPLIGHRKRP